MKISIVFRTEFGGAKVSGGGGELWKNKPVK